MLHLDTGNTGFMILCTSLVMLMTPGLAFFYGGLVGRKNVLAIMIQSFVSMGWTTVIWYAYGYSLCFSGDWHGVIGNLNNAFLRGINLSTPSPNDTIPAFVFSSVWAFVFTYAMLRIIDGFTLVKVDEQTEEIGLDESQLGEHAYDQLTEEDLVHFGH